MTFREILKAAGEAVLWLVVLWALCILVLCL